MSELIISADSHVIEGPKLWAERLPVGLRDQAPSYPETSISQFKAGKERQAPEGGWNPKARVKEMAVDGVSAEVLYPSFALDQFGIRDAELQEACFRVYNDWLVEYCSYAPDRLFGVACISTYRIDNAVEEVRRCHKAGFRGVEIWEVPPDNLSFATDHYERFWAEVQELNMPVSLHILTGEPYVPGLWRKERFTTPMDSLRGVNTKQLYVTNALSDLIASGVLERYPGVKIVLVETEVSWLPFVTTQWDRYMDKHRKRFATPLSLKPSEYCRRQVFATFFNDPPIRTLFQDWGTDNCMWSNDFPHANSTWPNSRDVIQRDLGHLPASSRAKLLYENVVKLYSLRSVTAAVA